MTTFYVVHDTCCGFAREDFLKIKLQPSHPGSVAEMTLTVVRMLDINIAELERILADLERCDQL